MAATLYIGGGGLPTYDVTSTFAGQFPIVLDEEGATVVFIVLVEGPGGGGRCSVTRRGLRVWSPPLTLLHLFLKILLHFYIYLYLILLYFYIFCNTLFCYTIFILFFYLSFCCFMFSMFSFSFVANSCFYPFFSNYYRNYFSSPTPSRLCIIFSTGEVQYSHLLGGVLYYYLLHTIKEP